MISKQWTVTRIFNGWVELGPGPFIPTRGHLQAALETLSQREIYVLRAIVNVKIASGVHDPENYIGSLLEELNICEYHSQIEKVGDGKK